MILFKKLTNKQHYFLFLSLEILYLANTFVHICFKVNSRYIAKELMNRLMEQTLPCKCRPRWRGDRPTDTQGAFFKVGGV